MSTIESTQMNESFNTVEKKPKAQKNIKKQRKGKNHPKTSHDQSKQMTVYQQPQRIPMTEENISKINKVYPTEKLIRIKQWISFIDDF